MRVRRAAFAAFLAVGLVAAACSGDDDVNSAPGLETVTTQAEDRSGEAAYAAEGPYVVGLTTVQLADRVVEVLYPATEGTGSPAGLGGLDPYISSMPLAIGWGLIFATPLTLVLVPCLYMVGQDIRRGFTRKK